jgi:nicotinate-nucleotide adenylyltransferase
LAQKLGILGGTFNPIHYGHLAAAEEVRDRLKLDRVLFIPSYLPPHKHEEDMPPAVQRLEMVRLAIAGNPRFTVSDIEVKRGGKSYTVETVATLRTMHPVTEFYFITGLDSFLDIQTWNQWERLLPLCSFVVLSRPGYRFADLMKIDFMKGATKELAGLDSGELMHAMFQPGGFKICLEMIPLYDISSTDIRNRIHESRTVKYHLPEAVETYIIKNKLYA